MSEENIFVLRRVCYAGQVHFIEVPKSDDKGSVIYKDFLESGELYLPKLMSMSSNSHYISLFDVELFLIYILETPGAENNLK